MFFSFVDIIFLWNEHTTSYRRTPIHWGFKRANVCKFFCAVESVDINAIDKQGKTAMISAAQFDLIDTVRTLLAFNADTTGVLDLILPRDDDDDNPNNFNLGQPELFALVEEHENRTVIKF